MLLIHPPAAKPSEPPAGIARLAGFLRSRGAACRAVDLNLEALRYFLEGTGPGAGGGSGSGPAAGVPDFPAAGDTFTRRAVLRGNRNLALLRSPSGYSNRSRYRQTVTELERLLEIRISAAAAAVGGGTPEIRGRMADYSDGRLSPLRSGDLLRAAAEPQLSGYYSFFSRRLPALVEEAGESGLGGIPVVGISIGFLSQALTAFAIAGFIRRRWPETVIAIGGGLVTSWIRGPSWRDDLFRGLVDRCIAGPGEEALLDLVSAGSPVHAPVHPRSAGTGIPGTPDYRELIDLPYLSPGPILPYAASSGCCWSRCTFCPERAEGGPYLPVPAGRALAELADLEREHRPRLVHLLDSEVSPQLLRRLAGRTPGAPWYGFARISPELGDPDFARALAASGCTMLKLGIESGDQDVLDAAGKGTRVADASLALRALSEAGIATYGYLLFGTPAETPDAALRTLEFTIRHAGSIDYLNLSIFNLPAGSPEARSLPTSSFYEGDLSLYREFVHPAGWDRAEVRTFLEREFRRNPAVAQIVRRTPPVFTSNHAPLFGRTACRD